MSDTNLPAPRPRSDTVLHGEWAARSASLATTPKPRVRWRQRLNSVEDEPLTNDLLLGSTDGEDTVVVDNQTGEILWTIPRAIRLPYPEDGGEYGLPEDDQYDEIIERDGLVLRRSRWIFPEDAMAVDAYDARTGAAQWRETRGKDEEGHPCFAWFDNDVGWSPSTDIDVGAGFSCVTEGALPGTDVVIAERYGRDADPRSTLRAFDARTGSLLWERTTRTPIDEPPVVVGDALLLDGEEWKADGTVYRSVHMHALATGEPVWEHAWHDTLPAVDRDLDEYDEGFYREVNPIDRNGDEWLYRTGFARGYAALCGDILLTREVGLIRAWNLGDGNQLWSQPMPCTDEWYLDSDGRSWAAFRMHRCTPVTHVIHAASGRVLELHGRVWEHPRVLEYPARLGDDLNFSHGNLRLKAGDEIVSVDLPEL